MNIDSIIIKKQNNQSLTNMEIKFVVENYTKGIIDDFKMTILLKAICEQGMTEDETIILTKEMVNSGEIIDLSGVEGRIIDKHSTGGVGDKVTLVVAPLVAAAGVPVAKMSGKALGFTGGTIDKLESIPGLKTNLTIEEFINQVNNIGVAISSTAINVAPADKKIYALRDITDTVKSIPLIASSIMSKKLASGASKIVLDVKVGKGAMIKDLQSAEKLAKLMVKIGNSAGKETIAILSNMNNPLGYSIGNTLEVKETIDILLLKGEKRITELCIVIAATMIQLGKNMSFDKAKEEINNLLVSKKGYQKFSELIISQKGEINNIASSKSKVNVKSNEAGYVSGIDTEALGKYVMELGAGRKTKESKIDYTAGIILNKKVGDYIEGGELLLTIHTNKPEVADILNIFTFSKTKPTLEPMIFKVIK